jgi:hypothetical protein
VNDKGTQRERSVNIRVSRTYWKGGRISRRVCVKLVRTNFLLQKIDADFLDDIAFKYNGDFAEVISS